MPTHHSIYLTLLLVILSGPLAAATLKIATVAPDGTSWMKEMRQGASTIKQQTDGRVMLKFYPGGVMGNAGSVLRKIRIRQLHGGAFTSGELSSVYQDLQIYSLPFLFNSYDEVDFVRDQVDDMLRKGLEENGFIILGLTDGGFGYMMSQSRLSSVEELRQERVWVPENDRLTRAVMQAAGIEPVPLNIADVYTGLQTGLVRAVANTPMGTIAFQWHAGVSHLTNVPLAYLMGVLAVEKEAFARLDPGDQMIVRRVMGDTFQRLGLQIRKDNQAAKQALRNQGMTFIDPSNEELTRWKGIANQAIQKLLADGVISRGIYDLVAGLLRNYRNGQ